MLVRRPFVAMGRWTAACLAASLAPSASGGKLPAWAFDKSTNWGQPDGNVRNWPGATVDKLTKDCDWGYEPYSQKFKHASMGWYPTTGHWANYDGHDLIPELHHMYTVPRYAKGLKMEEHDKAEQSAGHCEIDAGDGSRWVFQRVGVRAGKG